LPRTPAETKEEILKQISTSTLPGAQTKIENMRQATGIRDNAVQGIIDVVVEMGKHLRKVKNGEHKLTEAAIQKKLEAKLDELLRYRSAEDLINPLLGLAGKVFCFTSELYY
jgi:hypothetical protein